jgi:hypothetical protein
VNAIIVNCSKGHYNLGARKLADWLSGDGHNVRYFDGDPGLFGLDADLVALSVIFSWHAPIARQIALRMKATADIWCGGPGMMALVKWWQKETGLECSASIDARFDRQRGDYLATFASRGCPVNCWFCVVPKLEGREFTLDWDFAPAPMLCDNNLSALPVDFQDHIIRRYQETDTPLKDANSGFEPRTFDEGTYRRWKSILRGPWRFAFDEQREAADVERMMKILRAENSKRKRVYVLVGNEPIESCYERATKVLEWGGEPYCQPVMPLNALDKEHLIVRHDWTHQRLKDFARYFNRFLWKYTPLNEYNNRKYGPAPFAGMKAVAA